MEGGGENSVYGLKTLALFQSLYGDGKCSTLGFTLPTQLVTSCVPIASSSVFILSVVVKEVIGHLLFKYSASTQFSR